MKKENKELLLEAFGWIWLATIIMVVGIYGVCISENIDGILFGIMMIVCGGVVNWAIIASTISFWKK